jgi:hypothetical protein
MVTILLLIRIRDAALKLEVSHASSAGAIIGGAATGNAHAALCV